MAAGVIVFDMDGVLVDVSESYREAIRATVHHFTGREIPPLLIQEYKNAGGWNNDWALARQIIRDCGVEAGYDQVVEYFQRVFLGNGKDGLIRREKWVARPGLLARLGQRYHLAVFTGRPRAEARLTLARFAPEIPFEPLIGAEDVTHGKPAPEGLLKIAARHAGLKLWYVGDTVDDARAARAAGAAFVGITSPANPGYLDLVELFCRERAAAIYDDINAMEEFFANRAD